MNTYAQWATDTTSDSMEIDSADLLTIQPKPEPTGGELLDDTLGWMNGMEIMGVWFTGTDHYHLLHNPDGSVVFSQWTDTTGNTERWARVVTIFPIAADPLRGGAMNTKMLTQIYAASKAMDRFTHHGPIEGTILNAWNKFIVPSAAETFHGKQVLDSKLADYEAARTKHGWRHWGLDGKVPDQRALGRYSPAKGTRTVYQRDTDSAVGFLTADNENEFNIVPGTSGSETSGGAAPAEERSAFSFISQIGFPSLPGGWPGLPGDYRIQLDVSAVGADIEYGAKNFSAEFGGFYRTSIDPTGVVSSEQQDEGNQTGTGLKLVSTSGNFPGSNGTDRWVVAIALTSTAPHGGDQTLTLDFDTSDAFSDGNWPALTTGPSTRMTLTRAGG